MFVLWILSVSLWAVPLVEQFKQTGYVELSDEQHESHLFDALYEAFDEFIALLQANPPVASQLYIAKERFIRSKEKHYYSTEFFGFYDESQRVKRRQISFYYSTHFHEFIASFYPALMNFSEIHHFFAYCLEIQKRYGTLFDKVALELEISSIFASNEGHAPFLFKVVKYLPDYTHEKPHYDGTALSLLLDSTDNGSFLLSPYKSSFTVDDFFSPCRAFPQRSSVLLIPGAHLAEFSIPPTPHIVLRSGQVRYAAIAFAMRPHYTVPNNKYTSLPDFLH